MLLVVVFCLTWPRPAQADVGGLPSSALAWIGGAVLSILVAQVGHVWSNGRARLLAGDDRRIVLIEERQATADKEIRRVETELRGELRALDESVHGLRMDVVVLRNDLTQMSGELMRIRGELDLVRAEQASQKATLAGLTESAAGTREDLAEMREINSQILKHVHAMARVA